MCCVEAPPTETLCSPDLHAQVGISYSIGKTGSGEEIEAQMKSYFWQAGLYKCVSFKLYWLQQFVCANAFVISLFWRRIRIRKENISLNAHKLGRLWVYEKKGGEKEGWDSFWCILHIASFVQNKIYLSKKSYNLIQTHSYNRLYHPNEYD